MSTATPALAKLSRPRLHSPVARERLFERLDRLREHPVVWVCGPPGCGKTTLVASWLEAREYGSIWYQVDVGDDDVSTFFFYLGQAAKRLAPHKRVLPLLTPEYLPDLDGFARRYARELYGLTAKPLVIVLDNYQEAAADSTLHLVLRELISEVPSNVSIIAISRQDPPDTLIHHVANNRVARIAWEDLRLTREEARAVAAGRGTRDDSLLDAIYGRTDGWAGGLALMLEQHSRGQLALDCIDSGSREATFTYFARQAFDQASPVTRRLLVEMAFLPIVTPNLGLTVTSNTEVPRLLESLYRRNLFVERKPGREPSYQFHGLFREFLMAKAREVLSEPECRSLCRRTATALQGNGLQEEAFALFISAKDWDAAASLLLGNALTLYGEGRWKTIEKWVRQLPPARVEADPWLSYWTGIAEFQIDQRASRKTLSRAYERFELDSDRIGQMLTAASIVTGFYFEYVDWAPADIWINRLGELIEGSSGYPSLELELTVYSAMLYGIAIRRPSHPLLRKCIERTMALLSENVDVNHRMLAGLAITGPVSCMLGAFDLFDKVRRLLSPVLSDERLTELNRACWHMTTGCKLYMNAEGEIAAAELERAARLSNEFNLRHIEFLSRFFHCLHAVCFFDLDIARQRYDLLHRNVDTSRPLERTYLLWAEGMIACIAGEAEAALESIRAAQSITESIGSPAHVLIGLVLHGAPLVLSGKHEEAETIALQGLRFAETSSVHTWDNCFLLLKAWVCHLRGDVSTARDFIEQALAKSRDGTGPYMRWLLQGCRTMLTEALRQDIDPTHVRALLGKCRYAPDDPILENWPWQIRIRTLGRFEVEVNGRRLEFGRKVPKRPLALLQCLIALGGQEVPEHRLADDLWPDADGDEAHGRFALTLHRLRQLLGDHDSIRLQGGKVSLDTTKVWVDAFALEKILSGNSATVAASSALDLYRGDFLASEPEEPWMLAFRDRLRRLVAGPAGALSSETRIRNQKETSHPLV